MLVIFTHAFYTVLLCCLQRESTPQRKKRSENYCKQKRKRYRQKKKHLAREAGEKLAFEALKLRWRERCDNACAINAAEPRERDREDQEQRLCSAKAKQTERASRQREVEDTAERYAELCEEERNDTSPLLLNSAVIPSPCRDNNIVTAA